MLLPLCLAAIAVVLALEALLPGGIAVALAVCVPIIAISLSDDRRHVWLVAAAAIAVALIAEWLGWTAAAPFPTSDGGWLAALLALPAALGLALLLQQQRLAAYARRDAALTASEMNRLLMSLLAHDLRAPLSLADQGFQYVEEAASGGYPVDRALVAEVRARLQRSLRAIEMMLSLARMEPGAAPLDEGTSLTRVCLRDVIRAEIASFAYEAEARQKQLAEDLEALGAAAGRINLLALRQALAILLDNAVRYADPGVIRVSARLTGSTLEVRVADQGPGLTSHRGKGAAGNGSGLGLRLSEALLVRAGGSLATERDAGDGSTLAIRLPLQLDAPPFPQRPAEALAGA